MITQIRKINIPLTVYALLGPLMMLCVLFAAALHPTKLQGSMAAVGIIGTSICCAFKWRGLIATGLIWAAVCSLQLYHSPHESLWIALFATSTMAAMLLTTLAFEFFLENWNLLENSVSKGSSELDVLMQRLQQKENESESSHQTYQQQLKLIETELSKSQQQASAAEELINLAREEIQLVYTLNQKLQQEISEHRNAQPKHLQEANASLQVQDDFKVELQQLQEQVVHKDAELIALKDEQAILVSKLQTALQLQKVQQETTHNLNVALDKSESALQQEKSKALEQKAHSERAINALKQELDELLLDRDLISQQLTGWKFKEEQHIHNVEQVEALQKQLRESEIDNTHRELQIHTLEKELQELSLSRNQALDSLDVLQKQLEKLSANCIDYQELKTRYQQSLAEEHRLHIELQQYHEQLQELDELKLLVDQLSVDKESSLNEFKVRERQLLKQITEISRENEDIQSLQEQYQQTLAQIKNNEKLITAYQKQLNDLSQANTALQEHCEEKDFILSQAYDGQVMLRQQLEELSTKCTELDAFEANCQSATQEAAALKSIIEQLSIEKNSLQLKLKELADNTPHVDVVTHRELRRFEGLYNQLREQFTQKSATLDVARRELFLAQEQIAVLQHEKSENQMLADHLHSEILRKELSKAAREIEDLDKEIETLHEICSSGFRAMSLS